MVCRQGSGADPSSQIVLHTTHIVSIMTQIVIVSLSHRAAACRETQIVPLMTQIVQSGVELCAKWCGASKPLALGSGKLIHSGAEVGGGG